MNGRPVALLVALAGVLIACGDDATTTPAVPSTSSSTATTTTTTTTATPSCRPVPTATSQQERVEVGADAPRAGWYLRYVPATRAEGPPALVVDLHGFVEGAQIHTQMSEMATLAEREGFVLVSPQGTGQIPFWNSGQRRLGPPDVGFLAAAIDEVEEALCTDPHRVFVTGLSNGAFMASTLGCELAERVAAIAPVAGVRFEAGCTPSRPMPVIAFHGTDDGVVSFDGRARPDGEGLADLDLPIDQESAANFAGIEFPPVPEIMADWAAANGCEDEPIEEPVGPDVVRARWNACDDGADVELYRVEGGGHSWPGSAFSASLAGIIGPTTMTISANELMWAFFDAHPLP